MEATTRESMASSVKNEWGTPRVVVDPLDAMGGIELDPCANLRSVITYKKGITLPQDGLVADWYDLIDTRTFSTRPGNTIYPRKIGIGYVNPPYGRQVKKWMEKCAVEARKGCEIVSLVAARVDTKWFQENIFGTAQAVCFWKGRIRFIDLATGLQGDPAFFPSALVYWGPRAEEFSVAYQEYGYVMELKR